MKHHKVEPLKLSTLSGLGSHMSSDMA